MAVRRSAPKGDEVTWAIRAELKRVDRELVEGLAERLELVRRLWAHKGTVGLPLEDRGQEGRVLGRARRTAKHQGLNPTFVEEIFRVVIAEGKRTATRVPRPLARSRSPVRRSRARRKA